jgi:cell division septal protein FtsQ
LLDIQIDYTWRAVAENNNHDSGREHTNRRASLIALGVVIVLFVIGWILTRELYSNSKIEDCVMSGRTNCVQIDTKSSTY